MSFNAHQASFILHKHLTVCHNDHITITHSTHNSTGELLHPNIIMVALPVCLWVKMPVLWRVPYSLEYRYFRPLMVSYHGS